MATIALIHDSPTPTASDTALRNFIQAAGHTCNFEVENSSTAVSSTTYDMALISESGSSSAVNPYVSWPKPVLSFESGWNTLGLSTTSQSSQGSGPNITLISGHSINSGFSSPLNIGPTSSIWGCASGTLASGVTAIAQINAPVCAVADSGATLHNGPAPAKRCCFGLISSRPGDLNANGQAYVLAIIDWMTGGAAPVDHTVSATDNLGITDSPFVDLYDNNSATGSDVLNITETVDVDLQVPAPPLPQQITTAGVSPESHSYVAPVIDTNGNLYVVTESTLANNNQPRMMKSSDAGSTWTEMDAANRPATDTGSIGDLESGWLTYEAGGFITFTWQRSYAVYSRFRASDHPTQPDTWTSNTRENVSGVSASPQYMSHTSPTDQSYQWMFYGNGTAGSYRSRSGFETYGTQGTIDSACIGPAAWLGNNNASHIIYKKSGQLHYKKLTSGGTLDGTSTRVDTNGTHASDLPHARPVPYMNGGTEIVTCVFTNGSGQPRAVDLTNGTPGSEQVISNATVLHDPGATGNAGAIISADVDGTTVHVVYSDATTGNMMYSSRPHGGSWSTPVSIWDRTASTGPYWLYCRVLEHADARRVLSIAVDFGPFVDDTTDLWYDEVALTVPSVDHTVDVTDTAGITDAISTTMGHVTVTADSAALSDSVTVGMGLSHTVADTAALSDSATVVLGMGHTAADNAALSDSVSSVMVMSQSPTDSAALSDAATTVVGLGVTASDAASLSDSVTVQVTQVQTSADALGLSDSSTVSLGHVAALADSMGLADSAVTSLAVNLVAADTVALSDNVSLAMGISVTASDAMGLSDSAQVTLERLISETVADSMSATDSAALAMEMSEPSSDALGASDSATLAMDLQVVATDTLGLDDAVTAEMSGQLAEEVADDLGITDAAVVSLERAISEDQSDGLQALDSAVVEMSHVHAATEQVGLADSATIDMGLAASVADTLGLTDSATAEMALAQDVADSMGLSDSVATQSDMAMSIEDTMGLVDVAEIVLQSDETVGHTDAVGLVDDFEIELYGLISQGSTDQAGITDSAEVILGLAHQFADDLGLSDSILAKMDSVLLPFDAANLSDAASVVMDSSIIHADSVAITDSVFVQVYASNVGALEATAVFTNGSSGARLEPSAYAILLDEAGQSYLEE